MVKTIQFDSIRKKTPFVNSTIHYTEAKIAEVTSSFAISSSLAGLLETYDTKTGKFRKEVVQDVHQATEAVVDNADVEQTTTLNGQG